LGGVILQKRRLGKTNIEISLLGLGTVKFGREKGVKYPHSFSLPTDHEIQYLLDQAKSFGINLLDTAPAYGNSEERLGKLLHGKRHEWVISTKAGEEFINGQSHFDFSPIAITHSIERSLIRLKTDYLDIVLIHSNGEDERIIEEEHTFSLLAALKKEGKIRSYGMSTKTIAGGLLAIDRSDVVMVTYNPTHTGEREVLHHAHQQQKGILIKKALASGHVTSASQALDFVLQEPGISSIIIGTINPEHLANNVESVNKLGVFL
jgi:aryl-alcohol dehydrogenase-like predicted oxidoreductase